MSGTTELLNKLIASPVPEICDLGKKALELSQQFETGQISRSEYDELMEDIISLKNIKEHMVSLEIWREINNALEILIKVKTITSLF